MLNWDKLIHVWITHSERRDSGWQLGFNLTACFDCLWWATWNMMLRSTLSPVLSSMVKKKIFTYLIYKQNVLSSTAFLKQLCLHQAQVCIFKIRVIHYFYSSFNQLWIILQLLLPVEKRKVHSIFNARGYCHRSIS